VQEDYFLNFIMSCVFIKDKKELYKHIRDFRRKFLMKQLEDNYYYDLDEDGYIFKDCVLDFCIDKNEVLIKHNLEYLNEIINLFL
jgi:hypothetical protein